VTTTLMGLGSFPSRHALSLGMLGMHGSYATNTAVTNSDLLIAVGARFDDRVTGRINGFAPNARKSNLTLTLQRSTRTSALTSPWWATREKRCRR